MRNHLNVILTAKFIMLSIIFYKIDIYAKYHDQYQPTNEKLTISIEISRCIERGVPLYIVTDLVFTKRVVSKDQVSKERA